MAATKYTYSVSSDTLNGVVHSGSLHSEVSKSGILISVNRVDVNGDVLDVWMNDALSTSSPNDVANLLSIVNLHSGVSPTPPPETVIIQEEEQGQTQGHYQACSHTLVVDHAINTWKSLDISFPYPISIFSASFVCKAHHELDEVEVMVAPNKLIGAITSDVSVGDTVINVQQSVIDNTQIGYHLELNDGTNTDDLGRVLNIDKVNNQITVETATVNAFASATPTDVRQTIYFVKNITLPVAYVIGLGKDVIGGSLLPKDTTMRIRYKNVEGTTTNKNFTFIMEYKY